MYRSPSPRPPGRVLRKTSCGEPPSSFSKWADPVSFDAVFTPVPRLTGACQPKSSWVCGRQEAQISWAPNPPGRSLAKNIQWPSRDNDGTRSPDAELSVGPRLTGASQASSSDSRCETQISSPPRPPGRLELK